MGKDITLLAIESSCDETAAAVVRNGKEVLSNVISSKFKPFLASISKPLLNSGTQYLFNSKSFA